MSYTSLWTVNKNWSGKEHTTYKNSHLVSALFGYGAISVLYISVRERNNSYESVDG